MTSFFRKFQEYFDLKLILTSVIAALALFASFQAFAQNLIKIDGSSTVFPITEAVAEEFQTQQKGKVKVTVGVSGTGGGFKKFCRGETDVQNASRPIQSSEMENCKAANVKYYELPVAFDAIAIVVHPKNTWLKEITVEELKKIWNSDAQGKITKWNQVNPQWPDQEIKLFGPGADSGTFDYFTEAINGKSKQSRGDYTASEDDNMIVQGVSTNPSALGYFGLAYADANKGKLRIVPVVSNGKPISPTKATVETGDYKPLARPVFIYVNESSFKKLEVADFTKFYLKNASKLVPEVKYIALPNKAYELGQEILTKNRLGTKFDGHSEVGMKVEDLMKKEGKL
jgi:phosphate transport system substrate-binding protein